MGYYLMNFFKKLKEGISTYFLIKIPKVIVLKVDIKIEKIYIKLQLAKVFRVINLEIFKDIAFSFRVTFLNKCDELERTTVAEFFQRCFLEELDESLLNTNDLNTKNRNE